MLIRKTNRHEANGIVFNLQRYSLHDGPGIRTTVFLKGCPLRCRWCCNPESQRRAAEMSFNERSCMGVDDCGHCSELCHSRAICDRPAKRISIDRQRCDGCLACASACPTGALHVFGSEMSVSTVMTEVEKDEAFHARSGGGLTLSGGEPLYQFDFSLALLKEARRRHIHTAMETCGFAPWKQLSEICNHLDYILYDIKTLDPDTHKKYTGVSNEIILNNFKKLCTEFPDLPKTVRTPVVPGFNDSMKDILAIVDFLRAEDHVHFELLPYHTFGESKYRSLGLDCTMDNAQLDTIEFEILNARVRSEFTADVPSR